MWERLDQSGHRELPEKTDPWEPPVRKDCRDPRETRGWLDQRGLWVTVGSRG